MKHGKNSDLINYTWHLFDMKTTLSFHNSSSLFSHLNILSILKVSVPNSISNQRYFCPNCQNWYFEKIAFKKRKWLFRKYNALLLLANHFETFFDLLIQSSTSSLYRISSFLAFNAAKDAKLPLISLCWAVLPYYNI